MRKTLIALAVAGALLGGASAANASTWTASGGTPVVDPTPPITVTGLPPVIVNPPKKHHHHKPKPPVARTVAVRHTSPASVTAPPPVLTYAVKANLWQHTAANDATSTRIQLIPGGSQIVLTCWTTGTVESGDSVWYRTTWGDRTGYVAGFYVMTGQDPLRGLGHC